MPALPKTPLRNLRIETLNLQGTLYIKPVEYSYKKLRNGKEAYVPVGYAENIFNKSNLFE